MLLEQVYICSCLDRHILSNNFGDCTWALVDWTITGLAWIMSLGHWAVHGGALQT